MKEINIIFKHLSKLLRKDKGLNTELDRLATLSWILLLKHVDYLDYQHEQEAIKVNKPFSPIIAHPYCWQYWAAKEDLAGDDLIAFINNDDTHLPDGTRGLGLFAYLRSLQGGTGQTGQDFRDTLAKIFQGIVNRVVSGYILRDVLNIVNTIEFNNRQEICIVGDLYDSILKEMGDTISNFGEFYTPQSLVRTMVKVIAPKTGETILDPVCGTGGFLVECYKHLEKQCQTAQDWQFLQNSSLVGEHPESVPYLLANVNLILHGLEHPHIELANGLGKPLEEIGEQDQVDIILTNPPFGEQEEEGILHNFPPNRRTKESSLLFMQVIMQKLRRKPSNGRAVIMPNGFLFGNGVCTRIKEELLNNYNLHTIVRLPNGVFAPHTGIATNLLFFDCSGPTRQIWYYELPQPEGRKSYTKTNPIRDEDFLDLLTWFQQPKEKDCAWQVSVDNVIKYDENGCLNWINLDIKKPKKEEKIEYIHPQDIIVELLENEKQITHLMLEIKEILMEVEG